MTHKTIENLRRVQAFVSIDHNRRIADGESVAKIGFLTRDASNQLNSVQFLRYGDVEPVLVSTDELIKA